MELKQLVDEAYAKSKNFRKKWDYWVIMRKKPPGLKWLMPMLETALGKEYVKKAAQDKIESDSKAPVSEPPQPADNLLFIDQKLKDAQG